MTSKTEENKSSCGICSPCRCVCRCASTVAHALCRRQVEDYLLWAVKKFFVPTLIALMIATPIGIMIRDGALQVGQATWDTSSVVIDAVWNAPQYMAPVTEMISTSWNNTYTAISITGSTVSQHVQTGYNILAPFINKTSELSNQIQQGYQSLVPYVNQTVSYLRKKDEDKLT